MSSGISFPFRFSAGELPAASDTEESVGDSIVAIINTRIGERVMRPTFGSRCWEFVFENTNALSMARLRDEARRALSTQEPRIKVLSVTVAALDPSVGGAGFSVDVTYRLSGQVQTTSTELSTEAA